MRQFPVNRVRHSGFLALIGAASRSRSPRRAGLGGENDHGLLESAACLSVASIQRALNASVDSDLIVVAAGTYSGGLSITTSVTLLGGSSGLLARQAASLFKVRLGDRFERHFRAGESFVLLAR
jgi:hypothetical protein